jgi:hypothetical protein
MVIIIADGMPWCLQKIANQERLQKLGFEGMVGM